jgi:hypothetical protein
LQKRKTGEREQRERCVNNMRYCFHLFHISIFHTFVHWFWPSVSSQGRSWFPAPAGQGAIMKIRFRAFTFSFGKFWAALQKISGTSEFCDRGCHGISRVCEALACGETVGRSDYGF